jgi:hypothetical protein
MNFITYSSTPNLDPVTVGVHSQVLRRTSDLREDDTYSIVSDKNTDPQQDHTYDTAEFHNQTNSNEEPQYNYNTLQRDNTASFPTWSNSSTILFDTYDKIGANNTTISDAHSCFKLGQLRGTRRTDSESEYDVIEDSYTQNVLNHLPIQPPIKANQILREYEPVYDGYESSITQTKELAAKRMLFDDETHGAHKPAPRRAAIQLRVGVEAKPNSETVKEETPIAHKEVQYAEPLTPNDKNHVRDVQAQGEHFYHSLELNEPTNPEKCINGDPYSRECSNPVHVIIKEPTFGSNNDTSKAKLSELATFGSNNDLTSKSKSSKLATLPKKDQFTADTKCQAHTFTSLYDTCSDNTMGEAGATNDPILFNLKFDDPMYEGIPHSVPKQKSNPSLHIALPEEVPCIGGVNAHPDFLTREEDTNTPGYSDPGCLDNTNMANGQEDTTVNIYDTPDDPTFI